MKRSAWFIFLVLLFLQNVRSQETLLASKLFPELRYHDLKGEVYFTDYRQIKGSPFLYDDWMMGDVLLDDGKTINDVMIKLDVFAHRILIYQENLKRVVLIEKQHAAEFTLNVANEEKKYRKLLGVNSKSKVFDGCYFEVLEEGNISLYKLNYLDIYPINSINKIYIEEFIKEWRHQFVDTLQPRFLPEGWSIDAPVTSNVVDLDDESENSKSK